MLEQLLGPIPPDWRYMTLGELCLLGGGDIQTGPFGSQLHASDYVAQGIPSIMPINIGDNRISDQKIARISLEDAVRLERYRVRRGDIVYSRRGDVERRALIREREDGWLCGTGCLRIRLGKGLADPAFVSLYLGHPAVREWVVRHAHGATMPNLNTSILSSCPVVVPPFAEQLAIAAMLGAFDDKIALNGRMNETLEETVRAVFRDWFVDFGPTRAKAEGRAPYLAPEVWAIFPASLDAEGNPDGWKSYSLDKLAVLHGKTVIPANMPHEIFKHFSLPAYDAGQTPTEDRGDTIKSNKTAVPEGAVLLSKLNPEIERVWLPEPKGRMSKVSSTEFLVFTPREPSNQPLLYGLFTEQSFRGMLRSMVTGTSKSHQRVSPSALLIREVLVGTSAAFDIYAEHSRPLLDRVVANRTEVQTLVEARDVLLPKLVSGEIRIKVANSSNETAKW